MAPRAIAQHLSNLKNNPVDSSVDLSVFLPNVKMITSRASYIRASTRDILTIEDLRHWSNSRLISDKIVLLKVARI